jgi:hypothetical protein
VAKTVVAGDTARILLETQEDIWFWERRFNVFDFLELFPAEAITETVPDTHVPPPAEQQLMFETDAGFAFETDIVRGGFYLRNQTQGTRKWMAVAQLRPGDSIEITRLKSTRFSLRKIPA